MEYLKSSAHLQALLIEEGITDSEHISTPTVWMPSSAERANEAYRKYRDAKSADAVASDFMECIDKMHKAQHLLRKNIEQIQNRIDAYERVILRLCPPPPPPTPEEELARLKQTVNDLLSEDYGDTDLRIALNDLVKE